MRVVRVYHSGRSPGHRARERALVAAGVDLTLVIPSNWTEGGAEAALSPEAFPVIELPVKRPDDVNRHSYVSSTDLRSAILTAQPDVVDIHEEPFSSVMRQVLGVLPTSLPAVGYAAQNVDKRYPPPFNSWERSAYSRLAAIYPCSRQAASVVRGRGYSGILNVLPLGYDPDLFHQGDQRQDDDVWTVSIAGRLVHEKGIRDAMLAFASVERPARLVIAGSGPLSETIPAWSAELGIADRVSQPGWLAPQAVAGLYRESHVVLVPSVSTTRWVEQFGRMVVEAQACGAVVAGYASGSLPEICQGAAVLAAEGDTLGLGRSLADLSLMPGMWAERRATGLRLAEQSRWEAVARKQAGMYDRSLAQSGTWVTPGSRELAVAEFGATASLRGGASRPFALPVLRQLPRLAKAVDRWDRLRRSQTTIRDELL